MVSAIRPPGVVSVSGTAAIGPPGLGLTVSWQPATKYRPVIVVELPRCNVVAPSATASTGTAQSIRGDCCVGPLPA